MSGLNYLDVSDSCGAGNDDIVRSARKTFDTYASAMHALSLRVNGEFEKAVQMILSIRGRVVVSGMGKSGHIGKKIAATFASTGTPSFFVHPGEAYHGDLGMVTRDDLVVLISYSGETEEIVKLVPQFKRFGVPMISFVGKVGSTLGKGSDLTIDIGVEREVCPHNLAPTTSTLTTLAMGDALAVALMEKRGFMPEDFARFHPGGSLGRRLLTRVKDVMHVEDLPKVRPDDTMQSVIFTMTKGRLGMALVMEGDSLRGVITDGDLRRTLLTQNDIRSVLASDVMNKNPKTINEDSLVVKADEKMTENKISHLVALNAEGGIAGIVGLRR